MLQINDPCPVNRNQLQKTGENCYFCKKCNEQVVDFTNASENEILAYKGQKICGIFREDQLAYIPVFHWRKALLFRLLTLISFFGFTVSPVHADELVQNTSTTHLEFSSGQNEKKWFKPKKKRRKKQKSKQKMSRPMYL